MTHTSTEMPEALRRAKELRGYKSLFISEVASDFESAAALLERQHARILELEATVETGKRLLREEMARANRYAEAAQAQRAPLSDEQILAAFRSSQKISTNHAGWVREQRIADGRALEAAVHGITQEKQG